MSNYYTLSSGNLYDSNVLGMSVATSEVTSSSTPYTLTTDNIVTNSIHHYDPFNRGYDIDAIVLPVSSRGNPAGASVDITLQSGTDSVKYTYPINSFYKNKSVDVLSDNIIQNTHTLLLSSSFRARSGDPINLILKTSEPDTLTLIGHPEIIDVSPSRVPLQRTTPRSSVVNVSGRFVNSTSILLNNNDFYRDLTYFTYNPNISSNNFTIEAWVYPLSNKSGNNGIIFDIGSINETTRAGIAGKRIRLSQCTGTTVNLGFIIPNNTSAADRIVTSNTSLPLSTWSHVALTRSQSSCFCFYNGTLVASATGVDFDFNNSAAPRELKIGGEIGATPLSGYISDLRVLANTAVYTTNFTVPVAPPVINEYTLFHLGTGINLNRSFVQKINTASIVNFPIASNIGGVDKSLYFSGSSSFLNYLYTGPIAALSSNQFISLSIYLTSLPDAGSSYSLYTYGVSGTSTLSTTNLNLRLTNNSIQILSRNVAVATFSYTLPINTWNTISLLKIRNNFSCYVNKSLIGTATVNTLRDYTSGTIADNASYIGREFIGYISYFSLLAGFPVYGNETNNYVQQNNSLYPSPYTVLLYRQLGDNFIKNDYLYPVDDLHVSTPVKTIENTNVEFISISAENVSLSGDLYIHNNASLNFISNSNIIDINGSKGIVIDNNSTLNIASNDTPATSASKIYLYTNGINVNNGNLNLYGSYKLPGTELLNNAAVSTRNFPTTNSNLNNLWLTGDRICFVPTFAASVAATPGFDVLPISSFTASHSPVTRDFSKFIHSANILMPSILNLSRNIIIQPPLPSNRTYLIANNDSKVDINGAEFNLVGKTLLGQNGIIINTNQFGSFTLNNCVVSADSLDVDGGSIGKALPAFVSNTSITEEYSLYLPPKLYGFISPVLPEALTVPENFTIDLWAYSLYEPGFGNSFHSGPTIFRWLYINPNNSLEVVGFYLYANHLVKNIVLQIFPNATLRNATVSMYSRPGSFSSNVWNHISIVNKDNYLTLYLNGESVGSVFIDQMKPAGLVPLSAADSFKYLTVGGRSTTPVSPNVYFAGYIYDLRINLTEDVLLSYPSLTSNILSTDLFRISRDNQLKDISSQTYSIYNSGNRAFMYMFSPKRQSLNNIQLKDNIFIAGNGEGIVFKDTDLKNSVISGNFVLSSSYQNFKFCNLNLTNTIIKNNYATSPRTDNVESLYIFNCSATDTSTIGGVYTFNSASTGTIVAGINNIVVSDVASLCSIDDGLVYHSFNHLIDNTSFRNITSIASVGTAGINVINLGEKNWFDDSYNITKLNLSGSYLSGNNIGILGYNLDGIFSDIYAINNKKALVATLNSNSTYINNFTALQTRNMSSVGIQIIDNGRKGILYINNTLLSTLCSTPYSSFALDNDFAELNIANTNISVTAFSSVFAPDKSLRGYYEFNNCNFGVSAITALSAFVLSDALRTVGLTHTNYNNLTGNYITYITDGNVSSDKSTSIESITLVPSERVTPRSKLRNTKSSSKFVAIGPETTNATISVQVHTSFVAENATYNGNNPRLMLKANPQASINEDTVLAVLPLDSSTRGIFTTLSATIPPVLTDTVYEFYVDCSGDRGWINVDNWQAT